MQNAADTFIATAAVKADMHVTLPQCAQLCSHRRTLVTLKRWLVCGDIERLTVVDAAGSLSLYSSTMQTGSQQGKVEHLL